MYFISPPNPKVFLVFGAIDHQFFGFGEKNGKLCFYRKCIFDIGDWKEFFLTDIDVVKCECCDAGLHAATGLYFDRYILIAAQENEYTRIFELDMKTMEFTRYKMLHETHQEFSLFNLNLCCKCLSPIIRGFNDKDDNVFSFDIIPQKYQNDIGIFRIFISINQSKQHCLLWKKMDSFLLNQPPFPSNFLINDEGEALYVNKRSEEDGRVQKFSMESHDFAHNVSFDDINCIFHEMAFSSANILCLTRRNEGEKSVLRLYSALFSVDITSIAFSPLDYCTVDAKFPSLESVHFFVSWRKVDNNYTSNKSFKALLQGIYAIPSDIYFQTPDGSTVTIPLQVLSLSELSYIALSRIPQPSQQQQCSLPIAKISIYDHFFQQLRKYCGSEKNKEDVWMSQEFIKKKIGWPRILPLIKAPHLPFKSK